MHVLPEATTLIQLENTALRLISFYRDDPVCFLSHPMLYGARPERVGSWLFMRDLHPIRTQDVDFAGIT